MAHLTLKSLLAKRERTQQMKITPRFLLWVYVLVFAMVIILATGAFGMYRDMAGSTAEITDLEAHKTAVATFGTVAQAFADLVKVALGAVIGALSASLQFVLSQPTAEKGEGKPKKSEADESKSPE